MDLRCKSKFTREQKIARTENYYQPIHALRKKIKIKAPLFAGIAHRTRAQTQFG